MLSPLMRQMSPLGMATGGALDWSLAGGTIDAANVVEHVENPTQGQEYAGGTLATAWSISFRTNVTTLTPADYVFAFDSTSGRLYVCLNGTIVTNGLNVYPDAGLFALGDHTYIITSSGTTMRCYRDNVKVGSDKPLTLDIGGVTTWRSRFSKTQYLWIPELRAGHVSNIELDATMRAGLHASMMALA